MKKVLAVVCSLVGVPLVGGGIFLAGVGIAISGSEPDFGEGLIGMAIPAALVGSFLCYAAWRLLRSDTTVVTQSDARPKGKERLCDNCGCVVSVNHKACEWCGADLK